MRKKRHYWMLLWLAAAAGAAGQSLTVVAPKADRAMQLNVPLPGEFKGAPGRWQLHDAGSGNAIAPAALLPGEGGSLRLLATLAPDPTARAPGSSG